MSSSCNRQKDTTQPRGNVSKCVSFRFGLALTAGFNMLWKMYAAITLQLLLAVAALSESSPV